MIELKDDDEDEYVSFSSVERSDYRRDRDEQEIEQSGFSIEQVDEEELDLDLDFGAGDNFADDDYTDDMDERKGDAE